MTWNNDTVRDLERVSIRDFVASCAAEFTAEAQVLDYGCGRQPYRDIVEQAGGIYVGHDRADYPANVSGADVSPPSPLHDLVPRWDVILCNQMIQYAPDPIELLWQLRMSIVEGGALILTGPTNWAEVEKEDLMRFTLPGIIAALHRTNFTVERAERRGEIDLNGFRLSVGYGVVARA